MRQSIILLTAIFLSLASITQVCAGEVNDNVIVNGDSFQIPATQSIDFVPLTQSSDFFSDPTLPRIVLLQSIQSPVKSQGMRGACTYFVFTSLVESMIKKTTSQEVDLSEEYLAWAGKVKKKLRVLDEGSSVAVNAATFQEYGYMLEQDMPYQPSWFDKGYLCENQRDNAVIDPICFSHYGPDATRPLFSGRGFKFQAIDSRSIDVVRTIAQHQTPVTISLIGHEDMWKQSNKSGDFFLTPEHKAECQKNRRKCGGHAVLAIGYDLDKKIFFIKNSWGEAWGNHGYGTITFDYMDQMSPRKFLSGSISEEINLPLQ